MEIIKKNRAELKDYFKTNAKPTEQNFKDLVDSNLNQKEDGIVKIPDGPIAIQSAGATQELLHFYKSFSDNNPIWKINQNISGPFVGLNISDETKSRLFIKSGDGFIGIGTTTPSAKLHIVEPIGTPASATTGSILLEHDNIGGQSSIVFKSKINAGNDFGYINFQDDVVAGGTGEANIMTIGTSNDTNDHIALMTNGNVGIGINQPAAKLDILLPNANAGWNRFMVKPTTFWGDGVSVPTENGPAGSAYVTIGAGTGGIMVFNPHVVWNPWNNAAAVRYGRSGGVGGGRWWEAGVNPAHGFHIRTEAVPNSGIEVGLGGNVGLGIAPSTSKLHLFETVGSPQSAAGGTITLEHGNNGGHSSIVFKSRTNAGSDFAYINYQDDKANNAVGESSILTIGNQNDIEDHIALMPSGFVGIGTQGPRAKLEINNTNAATGLLVYEGVGTGANPNSGTIMLEHGNQGGQSSIVFKSRNNAGNDFAYINYQDDKGVGGAGEASILTIGNQNEGVDHIAIMPSGNLGVGTTTPIGKMDVYTAGAGGWDRFVVKNTSLWGDGLSAPAETGGAPYVTIGAGEGIHGIMIKGAHVVWNPAAGAAAIRYGRSGGVASGKWWEAGVNGAHGFHIRHEGAGNTGIEIAWGGNIGLGIDPNASKLRVYEGTGTAPNPNTGTITLEHGDQGGQSSIVFRSRNNAGSDFGYISYQDDINVGSGAEVAVLTIGVENDWNDNIAIMPSATGGSVGIGTKSPSSQVKLDVAGRIRIADNSQGNRKVLTSDANGIATWTMPDVRKDFRPYGTPSYFWDGLTTLDSNGADPQTVLSPRNGVGFTKYNNFIQWGSKHMFHFYNLSQEPAGNDGAPGNAVYMTVKATMGVHNNLLISTIDRDRWSSWSVWLCDTNNNSPVKLARSANNANKNDILASTYTLGPKNGMKETSYHAWMCFPITADQVAAYQSNGNLKFMVTSTYGNTDAGTLFCSGIAMVPNPYGFMQQPALSLHWALNGQSPGELDWHSVWENDGMAQIPAKTTRVIHIKVVDPSKDLLVTFHEHNNTWYGGTLNVRVGGNATVFTPSPGFIGISPTLYSRTSRMRPESFIIPKEIVQAQLIKAAAGVPNVLRLSLENLGDNTYHFRGADTEIY